MKKVRLRSGLGHHRDGRRPLEGPIWSKVHSDRPDIAAPSPSHPPPDPDSCPVYSYTCDDHLFISLAPSRPSKHKTHTWHLHYWPLAPHHTDTWGGIWSDVSSLPSALWFSVIVTGPLGWLGSLVSAILTRLTPAAPGARPPPGPARPGPGHSAGQGSRVFTFNLNVLKTETIFH